MKVTVGKRMSEDFTVVLTQGHQSFTLGFEGPLREARWLAKMFRIALTNHNKEILNGKVRQPTRKQVR